MLRVAMRGTLSLLAALSLGLSITLTAAAGSRNTIRGSAQNLSRGQPAAADVVILVRLDRMPDDGMQPNTEAHSKTDAQGAFTFTVPYPDKLYLVRVVHQGVTYDQQASAGDNLLIAVFDAAPKVSTITGSIEIIRVGTRFEAHQKLLHVSDMYELRNESRPPITQAGASTFDVYLAANARIDSVLAAGATPNPEAAHEKIGLMIGASSVAREPGHYTVNYPLRPGATRFAFNYDVPYRGHATFHARHEYGFQQLAVMIPRTMHFSSASQTFQKLPTGDNDYQVHAAMQLKAGPGPAFEVSGDGSLPSLQAAKQAPPQAPVLPNSIVPDSGGTLLASPPRADRKLEKTSPLWPWQALTGGLTLTCILLLLRARDRRLARKRARGAGRDTPPSASADFPEGLKEELFQLEADRARGLISAEDYCSARLALEETVKRTVLRPRSGARIPIDC